MHAGISLRSYPRSDTKLSRPHPDTTLTVAPDSGARTKIENSNHFFNFFKLIKVILVTFYKFSKYLERILDFQNEFLLKLFYPFV